MKMLRSPKLTIRIKGGTSELHCKFKFPCKICQGDHLTHGYPRMDEVHRLLSPPSTQQLVVLTHPFPAQPQQ